MTNDEALLTNERLGSPSMALLPAVAPECGNGEWNNVPAPQPAESSAQDLMIYVHALRRHWLMAAGIGLALVAVIAPTVWLLIGAKYSASGYLRVAVQEKTIAFDVDKQGVDRDRFEIYKNTQQQLASSRFVLLAALRKPEMNKLQVIQYEQKNGDPVVWLMGQLSVSFPGKAEIMEMRITREESQEAVTLVRGVMDAYMNEVVEAERNQKKQRLSELDRAFVERETDARSKREDLKKVAEQLGTADTEALSVKQRLMLEELTMIRNEMSRVQFEVRRLRAELAGAQGLLKAIETLDVVDADVDLLVQNDPIARQLFVELGWRKMDQMYTENAVVQGAKSSYAERYQQGLGMMQEQFNARKAELANMVRQKKRSECQTLIQRFETEIAVMNQSEAAMQKEVALQKREAEKFGNSTVDIEMMRSDIKNLDVVLTGISTEREKLKVEIRSAPRVTMPYGKAEAPEVPSNGMMRMLVTIVASLAGLCCPAVLIAVWDARAKRINSCTDVSKSLRLAVIGSVPLIPSRVIRQLGSPSKKNRTWHVRLTESVDGIAARVLRKADTDQCRVIMVSSAAGGEGKTTLSTQLALSLARTGRRVVLVDFDLRRPSFDEVFGLPLEPGVCEALRQQSTVSELVHYIADSNLAVVTAGRWDRNALASLSNGSAAAMFKRLREDYDFVVVDTSPILPVADARFVSQHVDSVVFSVFRDVSQAPKIQAACEILSAFGVQTVEAVVTGPNENLYGRHMGYESTISA